jgi:monofunctional glycosyltransferase
MDENKRTYKLSQKTDTRLLFAFVLLPLSAVGIFIVFILGLLLTLPNVEQMRQCMVTSMNEVKLCPGDSSYVKYDQLSPDLVNAVVASEDATFFQHNGFDWHEISESVEANFVDQTYRRGGSTITQQLAKNVFLSGNKSLWRKLREAALTVAIERRFTKKEILERYFNVVEFGPKIYGVRSASQYYFKKAPSELHLLDAVYLAYLLPNPKAYSASFARGQLTPFAQKSLTTILRRLLGFKKISQISFDFAIAHLDQLPWSGLNQSDFVAGSVEGDEAAPTTAEAIQKVIDELDQEVEKSGPAPEEDKWD